jgi:hypothetical protein
MAATVAMMDAFAFKAIAEYLVSHERRTKPCQPLREKT